MCHSLYCSLCSSYFPVYMHEFCSFHPQDPDFPGIQFKTSQQPYGAFSCCQMAVYRFQPLSANQKVIYLRIYFYYKILCSCFIISVISHRRILVSKLFH